MKEDVFEQNGEHQGDHAVGAQGGIAHDLEHPLAGAVAEQTIGGVGDAVEVQAAGDGNQHNHRDHGRQLPAKQGIGKQIASGGGQRGQQADQRHPFHALDKTLGGEFNLHRNRIPGHELNHENERLHGAAFTLP